MTIIHLFNKHILRTYYFPGIVLDADGKEITDTTSSLKKLMVYWDRQVTNYLVVLQYTYRIE